MSPSITGDFDYVLFDVGTYVDRVINNRGRQFPYPQDFWTAFDSNGPNLRTLSFWESGGYTTVSPPGSSGEDEGDYPDENDLADIEAQHSTRGAILLEYANGAEALWAPLQNFSTLRQPRLTFAGGISSVYTIKVLTLGNNKRVLVFEIDTESG